VCSKDETAAPQEALLWIEAAKAIMTTDTYPKYATGHGDARRSTGSRINGIAKGAGMIAPDMATMLSFVVTDADIEAPVPAGFAADQGRRQDQLQRRHRRQRHVDQRHADAVCHGCCGQARRSSE
jgi:hypothetical protein